MRFRFAIFGCLTAVWALTALPAAAQDTATQNTADRMVTAWTSWAEAQGISRGQIVVTHRGDLRRAAQIGGATGPVDLASLSKAITGLCLADLVQAGRLNWSDPVSAHLPDVPAPLAGVQVAALVTQVSGLSPDSTQGRMPRWRGAGDPAYGAVLDRIATRPLQDTTWAYNNENYAVLGALITAITGQPDTVACKATTLANAPSAVPSPRYGRFAAWGGWRIELAEYAHLIWQRFGPMRPADLPHAQVAPGVHYGLGTFWRLHPGGGGYNYWHFGALCFADSPGFLTFSVLWANGWGATVAVDGCPEEGWFASLDQALIGAVFR